MAAGVVPQSSCSLRPQAPASICSISASRPRGVALAEQAEIHREGLERLQHAADMPGTGRAGRRGRAGGRTRCRRPIMVVTPELSASSICCGQMKWMCAVDAAGGDDLALGRDHLGARADDDVDAGLDVGIAGLADGGDATVPEADIGLHDAPVVDDEGVGDDGVDGALRRAER